jgi:hypothetical protein
VSKPRGSQKPSRSVDLAARTLAEFEEARRRANHERIRQELLANGTIVDTRSVGEVLKDAAPRLKARGWRITEKEER